MIKSCRGGMGFAILSLVLNKDPPHTQMANLNPSATHALYPSQSREHSHSLYFDFSTLYVLAGARFTIVYAKNFLNSVF